MQLKTINLIMIWVNAFFFVLNVFFMVFGNYPTDNLIGALFALAGALVSWSGYQTHKDL